MNQVSAIDCDFHSNQKDGVFVRDGAIAALSGCLLEGSITHHGLEVEGSGSDVSVVKCEFMSNRQSGVFAHRGAFVTLDSSK